MKVTELVDKIFEEDPITRHTETNFIFESGKRVLKKKFINDFFDLNNLMKYNSELASAYGVKKEDYKRKIKQRVKEGLEELCDITKLKGKSLYNQEALENSGVASGFFDFKDFMLFRSLDKEAQGEMYVYDMVENIITDIDPQYYVQCLPKEYRANFIANACKVEYDPYDMCPTKVINLYRQEVTRINLYKAPSWRLMAAPEGKPKSYKRIAKLLVHLFPTPEYRAYVICWMKRMILERNQVYLGLNGSKGIGKNLFVEILLVKLVGVENFGKANVALLEKEFNKLLKNKRLIFMDELTVDKKKHTRLKDFINDKQNIEAKGVDANNVTQTYNSFVISNNDSHDVYVEYDDRRFSWGPLTDVPLKEAFSKEWIDQLVLDMEDPEIIREFGEFVLNYSHDIYDDPNYVWKCEKFYNLAFGSLRAWQQFLVDYVLHEMVNDSMPLQFIKDQAEDRRIQFPTNRAKVDNFLSNYRHGMDEERVGFMKMDKKVWNIYKEKITKNVEDML